jgi:hypothetical protein
MGDFLGDAHLISRPRTGGFGPAQKKRRGRRIHATPVADVPIGRVEARIRVVRREDQVPKIERSPESWRHETTTGAARPSRRTRAIAVAILTAGLAACSARSGGGSSSSDAPIEECEAFLTAYEQCLGSLGTPQVAHARAEQTRSSLVAQAERGDAARGEVRRKCVANLSQLQTTCRSVAPSSAASVEGGKS